MPSHEEIELKVKAKNAAKVGTTAGSTEIGKSSSKTAVLRRTLQEARKKQNLLKGVGEYTTEMDKALLGKHVKQIYDNFKRSEPQYSPNCAQGWQD
jgi:hypothetical protein